MALFMEKMAGNIVQHDASGRSKKTGADYRIYVNQERICLTLRDYNKVFDPTEWYKANQDKGPGEATGISIVMALAQEIHYFSAFNSNNLVIWLNMS